MFKIKNKINLSKYKWFGEWIGEWIEITSHCIEKKKKSITNSEKVNS
jgi:hypothetical protein